MTNVAEAFKSVQLTPEQRAELAKMYTKYLNENPIADQLRDIAWEMCFGNSHPADIWYPIDTAPEGVRVMLWWIPKGDNLYAEAVVIGRVYGKDYEVEEWRHTWYAHSRYQSLDHITHWQPLPKRPKDRP
jgi:hypothetical protein